MRKVNTKLENVRQFWLFWLPLMATLVLFLALVVWVRQSGAQEAARIQNSALSHSWVSNWYS
jgi:hypothetical protein